MTDDMSALHAEPACWNCRHFIFHPPYGSTFGLCRRHPPTSTGQTGAIIWPLALTVDWCGEYKEMTDPVIVAQRRPRADP